MNYTKMKEDSKNSNVFLKKSQIVKRSSTFHNFKKSDMQQIHKPLGYSKSLYQEIASPLRECPFLIMSSLYCTPGSGDALVKELENQPEIATLMEAQLAYFRGNVKEALALAVPFLSQSYSFETQIGAGMVVSLCASYFGDMYLWDLSKQYIAKTSCSNQKEKQELAFWLAAIDSVLDDKTSFPIWFRQGNFNLLPIDSHPYVSFFYAKFLLLETQSTLLDLNRERIYYELSMKSFIAACEPLISQSKAAKAILPEIYLHLICAVAYHNYGNDEMANQHIDKAIELALPDQLISPFVEVRQSLDFLIDNRLRKVSKELLAKVRLQNKQLFNGWVSLQNKILGRSRSTELTTREREVARLATYGLTNSEIATYLSISLNTVKQALRQAMEKTNCRSRKDLVNYL